MKRFFSSKQASKNNLTLIPIFAGIVTASSAQASLYEGAKSINSFKLPKPALLGLLGLTLWAHSAYAANYSATALSIGSSIAYGINNSGQVAGLTHQSNGFPAPTLWSGGTQSLLANYGIAYAINDHGVAVGGDNTNAVAWSNGAATVLPSLGSLTASSWANGINNNGQVVGYSGTPGYFSDLHATLWDNGTVTDLGTLGGRWSFANDINNLGQIVGQAEIPGRYQHAALWENGGITDLGELGYGQSRAFSINDNGQIVGTAFDSYRSVAVLWQNGVTTALPNLSGTDDGANSAAYGINNDGLIVGSSHATSGDWYAALWQNGTVTDLNTLVSLANGVYLTEARGINDLGQIIAMGFYAGSGLPTAYLLTPISNVPVPAAGWLFGSALLGAVGLKRRRRLA